MRRYSFKTELLVVILAIAVVTSGVACSPFGTGHVVPAPEQNGVVGLPNPLAVPPVPREVVMDEVANEINDYFRIIREQRIRLTDNILTEGWIDTAPKIGSTVLEPWNQDSHPGFELMHSTLQTVRRWARVRVIPNGNQYLVDVKVYKELEDLLEPQLSTIRGGSLRHDNSLDINRYEQDDLLPIAPNRGWIPMGRDVALEQTILGNIQKRLGEAASAAGHF